MRRVPERSGTGARSWATRSPARPVRSGPSSPGSTAFWHRHVVTRKYWETRRDGKGNTSRVDRQERVAERTSDLPFLVHDATGSVLVYPGHTEPEGAQKVLDRFERDDDRADRTEIRVGSFAMSLPGGSGSGTYGYQYQEWVLAPGRQVFVSGEASDANGELAISQPSVISTKSETELLDRERLRQRWFMVAAAVLGVAGVVLFVIGLVR